MRRSERASTGASNARKLARPTGFEPVTLAFGGQYSIQLSYGRTLLQSGIVHQRPAPGFDPGPFPRVGKGAESGHRPVAPACAAMTEHDSRSDIVRSFLV